MRYLTEYTENQIYVQSHIEDLSSKMEAELTIPERLMVGDSVTITYEIATFVFVCTNLDSRPGCSANYFKLAKIIKHLALEVGAGIVVDCNFQSAFKQGDVAILTKYDGASGWWAEFATGVWNVGTGHDFFVIKPAYHKKGEQV